jgi:molybdate transport system substrate-binding protein
MSTSSARGRTRAVLIAAGLLLGLAASQARAGKPAKLLVFAAASTTDLVGELARAFEEEHSAEVRTSFASSSTLARQIQHGAPADVFISANVAWMNAIEQDGAIEPGTRFDWMSNRVALVAPADAPLALEVERGVELRRALQGDRLAIADPSHVPAGQYAAAALRRFGLFERLKDRMVHAVDVRAALALVERGEVAAGLVYATDAAASDRVVLVDLFPVDSHPPIVYPVAILEGRDLPLARRFVEMLRSPEAAEVLERRGFLPLPGKERE